jgi:hypothetical protein
MIESIKQETLADIHNIKATEVLILKIDRVKKLKFLIHIAKLHLA